MEGHAFDFSDHTTQLQKKDFGATDFRGLTELDDRCDSAYQSVSYDSGICLSNYKSTDKICLSNSSAAVPGIIEESLRNLNLRDLEPEVESSSTISIIQSKPITSVSQGEDVACLEDKLYEQDEEGDTRLHLAIIKPDASVAFRLIELTRIPEYLETQNKNYLHTPLHLAVITGQSLVVRALIISGASLTTRDRHGNTALHLACKQGDAECVRQLTAPPSDEERLYIWRYCDAQGLPQRTSKPLQSSDIDLMNYEGETCLHLALSSPAEARTEIINYLVNCCGANINLEDGKSGYTVLHQAIKAKDVAMVEFLLRHSQLSVNQLCYSGNTALDIAVSLHLPQMEMILRMAGAVCTESPAGDSLDDSQVDEFDDLMIGGLRLNV